jgi:type I restriction enzyme S subunit
MTRLKRVCTLSAGGTPAVDDPTMWDVDGLPWTAISDMSVAPTVTRTARHVSANGIAAKALPIGGPGTVLFAMYASVGATGVLGVKASWNQAILGIHPLPRRADARFIRYWLQHLKPDLAALTRSNTQDNLNAEQVGNFPFPWIAVEEQLAIADYLDRETARIDALIVAKQRIVALFEERFVRSVESRTSPHSPFAEGRLIPLKYVAKLERGVFSHRPRNDPEFYDGPHPFIQTGDVARARKYVESWTQTLNERGLSVSRSFPAGTLVMVIAANIGDVGITTFDACFPDSVVAIGPNPALADTTYLYFALLAAKSRLVEMAPITTQANLNVERIGSLVVRCPSLDVQRAVARRFDGELQTLDRVAESEEQSIRLLGERRQALISAAVTGQLEVPVLA